MSLGPARSMNACSSPNRRYARLVMPGRTASTSRCRSEYWAVYSGSSGRGPDHAHVALDHIEDLGQLVELARPQPAAERGDPRVALPGDPRPAVAGAIVANLNIVNGRPLAADPRGSVDHLAGADLQGHGDQREQREQDHGRRQAQRTSSARFALLAAGRATTPEITATLGIASLRVRHQLALCRERRGQRLHRRQWPQQFGQRAGPCSPARPAAWAALAISRTTVERAGTDRR